MKKTLIVGAALAAAAGAQAQGTITWNDHVVGAFEIHIYAPQVADSSVQITGNAANDIPAGSQAGYTGGLVGGTGAGTGLGNGNNITVELYALAGSSVAPASSLQPVSQYTSTVFTTAAGAGIFKPVSFAPGADPGIPNSSGGSASVAIAAWFNGGGAYTSLAAAQAAGVAAGESPVAFMTGLGGTGQPPATTPTLLGGANGLQSFSLTAPSSATPEPSTIALGVMGASAFLLRRRSSK